MILPNPLMLLQERIKQYEKTGERERKEPNGDYSKYLPANDPIRIELESMFDKNK